MSGLSIVIPTYRRIEPLRECLHALVKQDLNEPMEIIVVDQNDSDFLRQGLPSQLLDAIKLIQNLEPNVSAARNEGFKVSRYDTILFIDDDLEPPDDFCRQALQILSDHPKINCLVPVIQIEEEGHISESNFSDLSLSRLSDSIIQIYDTISAAFFIRKDVYEAVGGFDPVLFDLVKSVEDKEFFTRLNDSGFKVFADLNLKILHKEEEAGGCELRQKDYWENRANFIKGWWYVAFKRNDWKDPGIAGWWQIARSAFVNKKVLSSGWAEVRRNISLVRDGFHFVNRLIPQLRGVKGSHLEE